LIEFYDDTDETNVKTLLTKMTTTMVSNGSIMGEGSSAATRDEMNDGLLDTIIVKDSSSLKILDKLLDIKEIKSLLLTKMKFIMVNQKL
jgi:diacylglycerol kinase family enzyme